jgi:hypothetical protein
MNDLETSKKPFSLRRRLFWVVGVPTLVLFIISLGIFGYRESRAEGDLADVLQKTDEADPGWRLDEIEAARILPDDKDNSAVLCRELAHLLGPNWPDPKLDDRYKNIPLGELLDAQRKVILEDEMSRLEPVRRIARRMVSLPRGQHKLEHKLNPLATLMPDQQDTRKVAALLDYEMRYQANKDDVSEAVRAGRACVCVGRSFYDEPTLISALIRISIITIGTRGVERSLALGQSNEAELVALDALLAEEERHNTYLCALRGDRAVMYLLYKRVASGELPADDFVREVGKGDGFGNLFGSERRTIRRQLPALMRAMNRAVEIARLPSHEQPAAEKALGDDLEEKREVASLFIASMHKVGRACRRETAQVATMRGLIAVERYRMKHKKWPAKLADVVPEFLKEVPTDPFNGKPIRMVRVADGVIVYSVGFDGVDDGGKLNRDRPTETEGVDFGYQLWDFAKRRRPASPVVEDVPEEKDP